jgi:hypothetical protein
LIKLIILNKMSIKKGAIVIIAPLSNLLICNYSAASIVSSSETSSLAAFNISYSS